MRYLVFGFGSKSGMAVHNILMDFFTFFTEKTDNEVVGFGYEDKQEIKNINHKFTYISVKDPFFSSKLNRYRVSRKLNKLFKKDSAVLSWDFAYKKALRLFKNKHFDCVVAGAGNFFYTQAAYRFARKNNYRLILFYFDPFTNGLSAVNKSFRLGIEKKWYDYSTKIFIDKDGANLPFDDNDQKTDSFLIPIFNKYRFEECDGRIIYAGSLYQGYRGKELLESFISTPFANNELFDLFIGKTSNINCQNNAKIFDYLKYDDYLDRCRKCKAIIVVGNGLDSSHIPSKILSAISVKKPIIGLNINPQIEQLKKYPLYFDGNDVTLFEKINKISRRECEAINIEEIFPERNPALLVNKLVKASV